MSGLVFSIVREELKDGDKYVRLTDGETQLLKMLAQHAGEPVSREALPQAPALASTAPLMSRSHACAARLNPTPKNLFISRQFVASAIA